MNFGLGSSCYILNSKKIVQLDTSQYMRTANYKKKAYSYKITEDATIYVKRDYPVTIEHTTIVVSGLFEQTIDAYMIRDEAINVDDIKEKRIILYTTCLFKRSENV